MGFAKVFFLAKRHFPGERNLDQPPCASYVHLRTSGTASTSFATSCHSTTCESQALPSRITYQLGSAWSGACTSCPSRSSRCSRPRSSLWPFATACSFIAHDQWCIAENTPWGAKPSAYSSRVSSCIRCSGSAAPDGSTRGTVSQE